MNTNELKGNWEEQKRRLKHEFAILTDNDLMFVKNHQDQMISKLQIELGKTKEELQKIFAAI